MWKDSGILGTVLPSHLFRSGSNFLVHDPFVVDAHLACHRMLVSNRSCLLMVAFEGGMAPCIGGAAARARILFLSMPSRSAGGSPASTSAASSETVRYARMMRNAMALCGRTRFLTVLAEAAAVSIQVGAAYNSWLSTTDASSLLFDWQGPLVFDISLDRAAADRAAFFATVVTWTENVIRWSRNTPRYLREGLSPI
ncbi:hypothetical protein AGLY_006423 [Aphis glycines]|uniref:Uncharacterized protein n=1 Tax=Aphis glycines TaxID=307491 RepID=A0A6G0TR01_APHGL|nr:hypothetical protein AGLY_006423 [Aphis glycines]